MEGYTTVLGEGVFEYEDRKSIFISTAVPVTTEAEALDFLSYVKKKYPDARHHVYAYVLRENNIMRFSDDSEPQGTAGMPTLDVIRKNGCTNTAIVTIRYFGGTLLGTGGLVRAYSSSAAGALQNAKIITYALYTEISVTVSYSDYQKILPIIENDGFRVEKTDFMQSVIIKGKIASNSKESFVKKITETTCARSEVALGEEVFSF